jgi:hypothetical protein
LILREDSNARLEEAGEMPVVPVKQNIDPPELNDEVDDATDSIRPTGRNRTMRWDCPDRSQSTPSTKTLT